MSLLRISEVDIASAPLFGAGTFTGIGSQSSTTSTISRTKQGSWEPTPPSFTMRMTPSLKSVHTDALSVSQNADVVYAYVALSGSAPHVFPLSAIAPAGVHYARFVKVKASSPAQVASKWFSFETAEDTKSVDAQVKAGALAAGLNISTFTKCVLVISLPTRCRIVSHSGHSAIVVPLEQDTDVANSSLGFAVRDYAGSFGTTPLLFIYRNEEFYGTMEKVDASVVIRYTHGPLPVWAPGETITVCRFRDSMAFELQDSESSSVAKITYEYSEKRTLNESNNNSVVFEGLSDDLKVYNIYVDENAGAFQVSADGLLWAPSVDKMHMATYARHRIYVRLVAAAPITQQHGDVHCWCQRAIAGKNDSSFNLVFDKAQGFALTEFGQAPLHETRAAMGPLAIYSDIAGVHTDVYIPSAAILHSDRTIVANDIIAGQSMHMGKVSHSSQYASVTFAFRSKTTIGIPEEDTVLKTPKLVIDKLPKPEVAIGDALGSDGNLHVAGSFLSSHMPAAAQSVHVRHVRAIPRPSVAQPLIPALATLPDLQNEMPNVARWLPKLHTIRVSEANGTYRFSSALLAPNPTLSMIVGDRVKFVFESGSPFQIYAGTALVWDGAYAAQYHFVVSVARVYTYKKAGVLKGEIVATEPVVHAPYRTGIADERRIVFRDFSNEFNIVSRHELTRIDVPMYFTVEFDYLRVENALPAAVNSILEISTLSTGGGDGLGGRGSRVLGVYAAAGSHRLQISSTEYKAGYIPAGHSSRVDIPFNTWVRIRIEVHDTHFLLYVDDDMVSLLDGPGALLQVPRSEFANAHLFAGGSYGGQRNSRIRNIEIFDHQ